MANIPDFTEAEHKRVSALLFERYGKLVPIQFADSELQLGADPAQLTLCPTFYWNEPVHTSLCAKLGRADTAASSSIPRRSNTVQAATNTTISRVVS